MKIELINISIAKESTQGKGSDHDRTCPFNK